MHCTIASSENGMHIYLLEDCKIMGDVKFVASDFIEAVNLLMNDCGATGVMFATSAAGLSFIKNVLGMYRHM